MAWGRTKTEHSGPKRSKGHWGRKAMAKAVSKRFRRREDRLACDPSDPVGLDERALPTDTPKGAR
jgi:hypothetical protein